MPFAERQVSELRAEFVGLASQPGANRRELCQRFGISAPTGYTWLHRYETEGVAGLADRSRRPHHSPARTPPAIEQAVLALRAQHPTWGARKLRVLLARQGVRRCRRPRPSPRSCGGMTPWTPAQGAGQPRAFQRFEHPHPNALWQMDFKAGLALRRRALSPLDHPRRPLGATPSAWRPVPISAPRPCAPIW